MVMPQWSTKWWRGSGAGTHPAELAGQLAAIQKSHAVIEFDLQGLILTANRNFLDTMGYTLEEIVGQHHALFVEPQYAHSPQYQVFWERLSTGIHDAGRYKRITKYGEEVWLQASYNPIFDRHHRPIKVVKYATDVTD
jgi:methyl-accepting chemotaxis protein